MSESGQAGSDFQNKFNACDYIKTYYPDITNIDTLLEIAELMHKNASGTYLIHYLAEKNNVPHEIIENVAVFDFYRVVVEHLFEEHPQGNLRILDIGGGPTIYQHIGLSLVAEHITHSEYLEENRKEVLCWLRQEEQAHQWDTYFELVRRLFQYGQLPPILEHFAKKGDIDTFGRARQVKKILSNKDISEFKHLVRTAIAEDVVHCDMFKPDLGLSDPKPFDVVTSNFVTESAARTHEDWETGMTNMLSFVGPGGCFIQTAIKNASWYIVGDEKLPATPVTPEIINKKCEDSGFRILYQKILEGSDAEKVGYDGMIFTLAQRI